MKEILLQTFVELHEQSINDMLTFEKQVNEIEHNLDKIERRFVLGGVDRELYLKYKTEFEQELNAINEEIQSSRFNLSNHKNKFLVLRNSNNIK